jgi:hypothetical protein
MDQRTVDPATIEAKVDQLRRLGIDALRTRWRMVFNATPPAAVTKDILARMIAYRLQEKAFGGLDRENTKLLDRMSRGDKPKKENRRLKAGTVVVREYAGERHTVTVVPDGFEWKGSTFGSLSTIARAITGVTWNGPRFFGLRVAGAAEVDESRKEAKPRKRNRSSVQASAHRSLVNG